MKYLVVIPSSYYLQHPKNNREQAVFTLFKANDRKLLEDKAVNAFKDYISKAIDHINTAAPDEMPFKSEWTKASYDNLDEKITLAYGCQFTIKLLACGPKPQITSFLSVTELKTVKIKSEGII